MPTLPDFSSTDIGAGPESRLPDFGLPQRSQAVPRLPDFGTSKLPNFVLDNVLETPADPGGAYGTVNLPINPDDLSQVKAGQWTPQQLAQYQKDEEAVNAQQASSPILRLPRAIVADIAAGMKMGLDHGDAQDAAMFSGNIPAALEGSEPNFPYKLIPLPIDQVIKQESLDKDEIPAVTAAKISTGMANSAPLLATGFLGLPPWAARLMALGFSAQMIVSAGPAARTLGTELGKNPEDRDSDAISSSVSDLVQDFGFAPLTRFHETRDIIERYADKPMYVIRKLSDQLQGMPALTAPLNRGETQHGAPIYAAQAGMVPMPEVPFVTTEDLNENTDPAPNAEENLPSQIPPRVDVSQNLANDIQAALRGNQIKVVSGTPIDTDNVEARMPGGVYEPAQTAIAQMKLGAVQKASSEPVPTFGANVKSIKGGDDQPDFSLSGESDLTPSNAQKIIQQAIYEKHAKAKIQGASEGQYQWNNDELRSAESTFGELSKANQQTIGNAAHDSGFYQTEIAQRFRALAAQHGADVGFFKGDQQSPGGFFHEGRLWMRSNRPLPEIIRTFEHEMVHHQADESAHIATLKNDVDPQSPVAREILDEYNPWRVEKGLPPLSHDAAREEVVAHFLAGDTRYGDVTRAFSNPEAAVRLAQDYHASGGSAGSTSGQRPETSFELEEAGETGRERAPPRVKITDDTSAYETSQPDFSPFGESDLTPSKAQQIIQEAINEKHAKAAEIQVISEGGYRWNPDDIRIAESALRILSQKRPQVFGNIAHDADFYQAQIAQRLRVLAKQHGTDVGFYKGDGSAPRGFYYGGRIWVRSNRTVPELIRTFEHEMAHHRDGGPIVSALKKGLDLNSPAAQRIVTAYNAYRTRTGRPPLTEDTARKEIVAPFLAGDTRYGDLTEAFRDPEAAVKQALNYHASRGSAGSAGGQRPGLSFEPGKAGRTGRERAPPRVKSTDDTSAYETSQPARKVPPAQIASQIQPSVYKGGPVLPKRFYYRSPTRKVRIQSPQGDFLFIPQERLHSALRAGYKLAPIANPAPGFEGEWGKYDLRKIPVRSDPIALSQSFPKSETAIDPQELPKTSDKLRIWATKQLAKLPDTVRSPWGNEVVLHKGDNIDGRASHYISGGEGFGPSRDRAAVLPMVAHTIRNAMAYATVRGRPWSAYLYRYADGQLHVVIVDNGRGTIEKQFVAKQDPRNPNGRSDLWVLYRNGIEGSGAKLPTHQQPLPLSVDAAARTEIQQGTGPTQQPRKTKIWGGAYKDIEANGGVRHHMPAKSVSTLSETDGPAIWMEAADHAETASHGNQGSIGEEYRARQAALIEQGRFDEALQMDIDDIRSKFGSKYDEGIKQMLEYYRTIPRWKLKLH